MKKLMLLGGMLGFGIGAIFGRLQEASDSTILWRSCVAALAAGLLMRWWGRLWITNLKDTLAEQAGEYLVDRVKQDIQIPETTRLAIVKARIGQGIFREEVAKVERHCRLTGVEDRDHLVASHIKPWKDSDNRERLSGNNGLMLTPTPDHLFDKGFISFADDGRLLYATRVNRAALAKMKIPEEGFSAGRFSADQVDFLKYHRDYVFKKAIKAA